MNCSGVMEDCASTMGATNTICVCEDRAGKLGIGSHHSLWSDCGGGPAATGMTVFEKANAYGSLYGSGAGGQADTLRPEVGLRTDRFVVCRNESTTPNMDRSTAQWRRRYILGRELGAGQTAVVFEGYAAASDDVEEDEARQGGGSPSGGARPRTGRKVALKCFNRAGTSMFRQEVRAMRIIGVHPHVIRLLESYEGGGSNDDVLVLEHCAGGDVYELYAANNGCGMLEAFVAKMLVQLLSALQHIVECSVEHRDVKPENLLLYGPSDCPIPCLKLTDFGWASLYNPNVKQPFVPADGVGSLWYAPPELNPPVKGMECLTEPAPFGKSDMWSVGIIAYLLLVGHSPFNLALRCPDAAATEKEVIRLAGHGQINKGARAWPRLSPQARSFILALVEPVSKKRPSAAEALRLPFILETCSDSENRAAIAPNMYDVTEAERSLAWRTMDGFQRLCLLAIARAVAEPELLEVHSRRHFTFSQYGLDGGEVGRSRGEFSTYLEYLASELVVVAAPSWFNTHGSWADVLELAFRYLDVNCDGYLNEDDLQAHVRVDGKDLPSKWIADWRRAESHDLRDGILMSDFRFVVWSTCVRCSQPNDADEGSDLYDSDNVPADMRWAANEPLGNPEEMSIDAEANDEICERYVDEVQYP